MGGSFDMYSVLSLIRFLVVSWIIASSVTPSIVLCLQQVVQPSSAKTVIYVCQNKACCQRWKLKTPLPDILHDLIISNDNSSDAKRILIETSSCLGQCDKGPNLRITTATTKLTNKVSDQAVDTTSISAIEGELFVDGIIDAISLITQLDETLSIAVPSKLLAAVTVFEKALTESPTIELLLSVRSVLFGAKSKAKNILFEKMSSSSLPVSDTECIEISDLQHFLYTLEYFYFRLTRTLYSFSRLSTIYLLVSNLEEKRRYTSSIIRVLDDEDDLRTSTANARARIYQAEIILELGNYQEAINEVTKSIQQLTALSILESKTKFHDILLAKAYRIAADAYEQSGDYAAAIKSIQSIASTNPDMRTKVVKELERLQQLVATA